MGLRNYGAFRASGLGVPLRDLGVLEEFRV